MSSDFSDLFSELFVAEPAPTPDVEGMTLYEAAHALQNGLLARATGGSLDDAYYEKLRRRLSGDSRSGVLLPEFVRSSRDTSQFWAYIKPLLPDYAARRTHIYEAFAPLLNALETRTSRPGDDTTTSVLSALDAEHVAEAWAKALARRDNDPEGAITAARSLLETVCKVILDDLGIAHSDDDLPKLYGKVARALRMAPSDHTEEAFKQILGGCWSVVNGLGTLRNRLSDSHGHGAKPIRPAPRHAELAVNLAGAMASFLVQTLEARQHQVVDPDPS